MTLRRPWSVRSLLVTLAALAIAACEHPTQPPKLAKIAVTFAPETIERGQAIEATAQGLDESQSPVGLGPVTWTSADPTIATIDSTGLITGVGVGAAEIVAHADGFTGEHTVTVTTPAAIVVNEVESNGGTPGDWAELYNPSAAVVDLSGWVFKDNDDTHSYTLPAGTTIPAGGYLVLDEATFGFGLGSADAARIYSRYGILVDSYSWTAHAAVTYGRCPNGTGPFISNSTSTKGAANDCTLPIPPIRVNEVESNGGTPGDWIEFYNNGTSVVDLSNYVVKDNDDTHIFTIPVGTTIAAGGYLVVEEASLGFGLGSADAARLFAPDGRLVDSYSWTTHAATTYGRCPNGTGDFVNSSSSTKGAANDCATPLPAVRINEVESSGGTPGDWIELINPGATAVDLSGFIVRDNDDTHTYAIPTGTTIAAGGYYVVEEAALGFGLGQPDAARLFTPTGTLVDSYSWTTHATTTYGRCPNGSGDFATTSSSTKGSFNACPGIPITSAWPGTDNVVTVDGANVFGTNMSGLTYEGSGGSTPGILWAAKNGPGTLYRLIWDGSIWTPDPADNWAAGKALHYTDGTGNVDAEGVAYAASPADGFYISSERNNDANTISRLSILRFDASAAGTSLTAINDWNLTADLPVVGANLGLEGITWIPDSYLAAHGFFDETAGHAYNPAEYADHGTGIFFVGIEGNGIIYAYALNHATNGFTRIATISSGFAGVMEVTFDRELGNLWAHCDDGCGNQSSILAIDPSTGNPTSGRFVVTRLLDRPSTMPNVNNEGFAIAPQSECVAGFKPAFWSDDNQTGGHALSRAGVPCTGFTIGPVSRR